VEGRIAQAQGNFTNAIEYFEYAAALQNGLPYTEPPYWYYPVRQTLAAALLQARRFDEAENQFKRALERAPNNWWSYYGLAELYKARGNADIARKFEEKLAKTWVGSPALLQLTRL
jgi:tetratricopeptide (TPR) repeat protein